MSLPEPRSIPAMVANPDAWLRTLGLILLVAGLQAFVFDRRIAEATDGLPQALLELERERGDNDRMNEALRALQLYRRASSDEQAKRDILTLRDTALQSYEEHRRAAIEALREASDSLHAQTPAEEEALAELRLKVSNLSSVYIDRTGKVLEQYSNPPWYLQPTASFLNNHAEQLHALRFNHALYLMHSGDSAAATKLLMAMRDDREMHNADVDFALARLAFETWIAERDPVLFADSLERATRSVQQNAHNSRAKLFLEYLLSLERSAQKVDMDPEEGQGEGEGRGERGVISTERREF